MPASFDLALDEAHPGERVELVLLELQVDLFGLRHAEVVGQQLGLVEVSLERDTHDTAA